MNSMKKIRGRNLILFVDNKALAGNISCELSISTEAIEVAPTEAPQWREYITKYSTWSVNTSHLLIFDSDTPDDGNYNLFKELIGTKVLVTFGTTGDSNDARTPSSRTCDDTLKFQGYAICTKASISAKNGEHVNGTFEFQGTGPLS